MDSQEMKGLIDKLLMSLGGDLANAKKEEQKRLIEMGIVGLSLFGELLLDIKRIADAVEAVAQDHTA